MGKRGHGGKKRNKKQKIGTDEKQVAPQVKSKQTTGKIILDKSYRGKLRSVTVQNMDEEFGLQEIAEGIEYVDGVRYEMYSIERLNSKKITDDGDVQIVPSKTCKFTFKGDKIPTKLQLWIIPLECKPFWNNVIQCFKCLRYRHLSTTCKGYARCSKCGERKEHNHKCSSQTLKCANCKGEHDATDKSCPVYVFNKECNQIMASENVDYKTAVQIYNQRTNKAVDQSVNSVPTLAEQLEKLQIKVLNTTEKITVLEKMVTAFSINK